ncbi:hypothetical protein V8E36_003121, partial [Tilletia maclaganii]
PRGEPVGNPSKLPCGSPVRGVSGRQCHRPSNLLDQWHQSLPVRVHIREPRRVSWTSTTSPTLASEPPTIFALLDAIHCLAHSSPLLATSDQHALPGGLIHFRICSSLYMLATSQAVLPRAIDFITLLPPPSPKSPSRPPSRASWALASKDASKSAASASKVASKRLSASATPSTTATKSIWQLADGTQHVPASRITPGSASHKLIPQHKNFLCPAP